MAQATHTTHTGRSTHRPMALLVASAAIGLAIVVGFTLTDTGGTSSNVDTGMSAAAQQAWAARYEGIADAFRDGVPANATAGPVADAGAMELSVGHRAEADRLQGLVDWHRAGTTHLSVAHQADADRWQGLADRYFAGVTDLSPGHRAEAARWQAIADDYRTRTTNLSAAHQADADRWQAIADSYTD